jgi:hypothetical protein
MLSQLSVQSTLQQIEAVNRPLLRRVVQNVRASHCVGDVRLLPHALPFPLYQGREGHATSPVGYGAGP